MKQAYRPVNMRRSSLLVVQQALTIIDEYRAAGLTLTIRQLYYQFVSRDWLANNEKNYKRLIGIMTDARLGGFIDWDAIEDRTRNLSGLTTYSSPQDLIDTASSGYVRDLWADQDFRVEVWIEKEALSGVFAQICRQLRVDFMSCRGYMSLSEMRTAGVRMKLRRRGIDPFSGEPGKRQKNVVLHFGDHDPSGMDMSRVNERDLEMFSEGPVLFRRVALNMDQIEQYDPPPNPCKLTDSRSGGYVEEFGDESWELDALNPRTLRDLVSANVREFRNETRWKAAVAEEATERAQLKQVAENWDDVVTYVTDTYGEPEIPESDETEEEDEDDEQLDLDDEEKE
jgi:hypothetical protein